MLNTTKQQIETGNAAGGEAIAVPGGPGVNGYPRFQKILTRVEQLFND